MADSGGPGMCMAESGAPGNRQTKAWREWSWNTYRKHSYPDDLGIGVWITGARQICLFENQRVMPVILLTSEAHQTGPYVSLRWTSGGGPSPCVVGGIPVTADRGMRTLV
jgi:hypothetical protein